MIFSITKPDLEKLEIYLPPSKSISHRALILMSQIQSSSCLYNLLDSDDTNITYNALIEFGFRLKRNNNDSTVYFQGEKEYKSNTLIHLGNSGSSARFLPFLALNGSANFKGDEQLANRPFKELINSLELIGYNVLHYNHSLPFKVLNPIKFAHSVELESHTTSQIISGLMMAAPNYPSGLEIKMKSTFPSKPYIDLTFSLMKSFNYRLEYHNNIIYIEPYITDKSHIYTVEPDMSAASYWIAFSLLNNIPVLLKSAKKNSIQGDSVILEIAENFGGKTEALENGVLIKGELKNGIEFNVINNPDLFPTLAVMAAVAPGKSILSGIENLKFKESNRIESVTKNFDNLGIKYNLKKSSIVIYPKDKITPSLIDSYNDHRIAMAFAILGTRFSGISISNPVCVSKSYPNFWKDFTFWESISE